MQADRRALNITLNSIGTELTRDDRRKLYSNFGLLYPHGHHELASAEDFDQIRNAMEKCPPYQALFNKLGYGESQMLDKVRTVLSWTHTGSGMVIRCRQVAATAGRAEVPAQMAALSSCSVIALGMRGSLIQTCTMLTKCIQCRDRLHLRQHGLRKTALSCIAWASCLAERYGMREAEWRTRELLHKPGVTAGAV